MTRVYSLAAFAVVLALAVPVSAATITNPSFEDTSGGTGWTSSIAGWSLSPSVTSGSQRAGLFFVFDGFSPTNGRAFIGLTNNGGGAQTITSSTFTINNFQLRFDYVYMTQNPGDTVNKDPFTVKLVTTGGSTDAVSDSMDSDLSLGSIGPAPFGSASGTHDTGWQTFEIDTLALMGQTATLVFTLGDSDAGGDISGVLLDHVRQVPEPATWLLFGVGFLGVTLFGRRRLKRNK